MRICPECRAVYHEASPVCPTDGASLLDVSEDDARCGTVIDAQYLMLSRLGAGGMGTVYRAWQFSTGRIVALKLLAEAISDNPTATERFMREARMTAGLSSPHVVRVHDFGQLDDGTAYMAMELIDGAPLEDMIDGPMPPERAIELVRQVCIALEEAHGQGLVHRDLKPGNVIVRQLADGGDFAQVLDFGIAKVLDETQTALTHENQNPGTPAYMSPEQARNETVGPPTDLYALAVIFFEMLVGERPFTGTSAMSVLLQHVQATPPSLKSRLPDLPGVDAIDAVLQQGLAKQVEHRYATAEALRADLDRLKAGAAPDALTSPTLKPTRGFGWNMQALGCSVQLAVAVGALAFFVLPAMRDDAPSQFDDVVQAPTAKADPPTPERGPPTPERAPPTLKDTVEADPVEPPADDIAPKERKAKREEIAVPDAEEPVVEGAQAGKADEASEKRSTGGRAEKRTRSAEARDDAKTTEKGKQALGRSAGATPEEADDSGRRRQRRGEPGSKSKGELADTEPPRVEPTEAERPEVEPPADLAPDPRAVPPPPPPALPQKTVAGPKATPRPGPAPAESTDVTAAELERRLRAEAPGIRARCGPGYWPIEVLINTAGAVQRVRITQPGRAAHAKARCVLEAVRALTFPAPARPTPLRVTL